METVLETPVTGPFQTSDVASSSAVFKQLDLILSCSFFQSSKRHSAFLQFVVNKTVSGRADEIKERVIGAEVFHRPYEYDMAVDPVVRVAAGELRKRLAQYYFQEGHENELRIEIQPGSYVPNFSWPRSQNATQTSTDKQLPVSGHEHLSSGETDKDLAEPALPTPAAETHVHAKGLATRWQLMWLSEICVVLIASLSFALWWMNSQPVRSLNAFWKPILATGPSTLICIGEVGSLKNHPVDDDDSVDQIISTGNHLGPYNVAALAHLTGMLGSRDRQFSVILAGNANLTDLRSQPGILIGGAINNPWTKTILSNYRFQFRSQHDMPQPIFGNTDILFITDSQNPKRLDWTIDLSKPFRSITRDIALISRINSPITGQVELSVAGIGPYGTAAASEFITNPEYFKQFTDQAPPGWQDRDIQIVIDTNVINGRSGPPHIVYSYVH